MFSMFNNRFLLKLWLSSSRYESTQPVNADHVSEKTNILQTPTLFQHVGTKLQPCNKLLIKH